MEFTQHWQRLRPESDYFLTFHDHIKPLEMKLFGDLLVIGTNRSLLELTAIEPSISQIRTITLIEERKQKPKEQWLYLFQRIYPTIPLQVITGLNFEDLDRTFDSIVFIAAWNTFIYGEHNSIPAKLNPGGVFYGTTNIKFKYMQERLTPVDSTCTIKALPLPDHPYTKSVHGWSGIIIEKARV